MSRRNPRGLGDLPDPLKHERGEIPIQEPFNSTSIPPNIAYQARALEAAQKTKVGSPFKYNFVPMAYDARPVQGQDFRLDSGTTIAPETGDPFRKPIFDKEIPPGEIWILRQFMWDFAPALAAQIYWPYITVAVNGVAQKGQSNMFIAPGDIVYDTWAIAGAGDRLQIIADTTEAQTDPGVPEVYYLVAECYGQILIDTGMPKEFIPSNTTPEFSDPNYRRG